LDACGDVRVYKWLLKETRTLPHPQEEAARIAEQRKKRTFKKFMFRGVDLDKLLDLKPDELLPMVRSPRFRWLIVFVPCDSWPCVSPRFETADDGVIVSIISCSCGPREVESCPWNASLY
jgi:hypothetical protein